MDIAASILYRISLKTGISPKLIKGKSRKQNIVDARQIYMFALRQLGFSQQFIAKKLKYKDHTTVHHHLKKDCSISHENRLIATQIVKVCLRMAVKENARLGRSMKEKNCGRA